MNTYYKSTNKSSFRKYILFHRKKSNFVSQEKSFCKKFLPPMTEIFSCDRKFLTEEGNCFLWQEMFSCYRIFLLWQAILFLWLRISSSDRKFLPMRGNFFLRQLNSSCVRKFLSLTRNFFLWQEIFSKDRKFLPVAWKFLHTIAFWGRNIILVAETFYNILFCLI